MKKSSLAILAFALPALALIASCSKDSFGKAVTSIDDFLAVASDTEFKIAYCELKLASGSTKNNGSSVATSSASRQKAKQRCPWRLSLYQWRLSDFEWHRKLYRRQSDHGNGHPIFPREYHQQKSAPQRYRLRSGPKNGAAAKKLIDNDYAVLKAAYTSMQGYVGKSASDFANMTTLSLTRSIAGTTAGYTLYTVLTTDTDRTETSEYITLDQFNGKWAFSNYSKRVTQYILGSDAQTKYSITEYKVNVVDALSPLAVSLSTYSIYLKGENRQRRHSA
jgi:hypothetical protein